MVWYHHRAVIVVGRTIICRLSVCRVRQARSPHPTTKKFFSFWRLSFFPTDESVVKRPSKQQFHRHKSVIRSIMAKKKRVRELQEEEEAEKMETEDVVMADDDDEDEEEEEKEAYHHSQHDDAPGIDSDDHEPDNNKDNADNQQTSSPFMDAFYGLTATDPRERALAAQTILWHIQENPVDAKYAWQRLLRGLGSGRAAARQGNASALSLFLKIGVHTDLMAQLQQDESCPDDDDDDDKSIIAFVRKALLSATEPPSGKKKKGSDERDAVFGRLFGIVAVIRSGILTEQTVEELVVWCKDLAQLYHTKKWMREPTAHAMCLLLLMVHREDSDLVNRLASEVVIAEFLNQGDNAQQAKARGDAAPLAAFSAEQISLAILLQYLLKNDKNQLAEPWDENLLSVGTLPTLAPILASTSHVTQPRTHLAWDVIALALTESLPPTRSSGPERRTLKADAVSELTALFQNVLHEQLLGLGGNEKNVTDDRRALALCIVRQWTGVEFVSSLSGRTVLQIPLNVMTSTVLAPPLVRRLFVDLLSTKDHYLKPLATQVLHQITEQAFESTEGRIAVVKALLRASPRFDATTKSTAVSTLLAWQGSKVDDLEEMKEVWEAFIEFAQDEILGKNISSYEAAGLVDLMYHHGKDLVRRGHPYRHEGTESVPAVPGFIQPMIQRIAGFFMTRAFFDCTAIKSKKNKSALVKMAVQRKTSLLSYDLRCVLSSRYYSLLAEQLMADLHAGGIAKALTCIQDSLDDWRALKNAGATALGDAGAVEESPVEKDESPDKTVERFRTLTAKLSEKPSKGYHTFVSSAFLLISVLYLHLLSCGTAENLYANDDPDVDDEDDKEDVEAFIQDISEVVDQCDKLCSAELQDEAGPLVSLAGVCVNVLSSPLTSGNHLRGASPKLLRECVRQFWIHGLITCAQAGLKADPELLTTLLDALGASPEESDMAVDSDESDEGSDSKAEEMDTEEDVFVRAALTNMDMETNDKSNGDANDSTSNAEEEIAVNETQLQSLLEQDNDDDDSVNAGELEHHAGADAALARLISLKQEARKAGQLARAKIELANQIRCVALLETLVMGKTDGWGALLSPSFFLSAVVPLLDRRRSLERDITKLSDKDSTIGEKRALLDRLTSLLSQKIFKTKLSSYSWSPDANPKQLALELGEILVRQAKERNSKDHANLVGASLVFVVKALPEDEKINVAKEILGDAVNEWANKQSLRLDAKVFENVIQQATSVAQAVLAEPLADAARSGKTPFMKHEAFRLLCLLFASSNDTPVSAFQATTITKVLEACATALQDSDMKQGKRVREVLKTMDKTLAFVQKSGYSPEPLILARAKDAVHALGSGSEGEGVQAMVEKLSSRLEMLVDNQGSTTELPPAQQDSKKGKKSKKKKGKKKR